MGIISHIKVYFAYLTNNKNGKQKDLHGRLYKNVYKKFGHSKMVDEYIKFNSWSI